MENEVRYILEKDFITPNKYSRPQKMLKQIKKIIIHWVANPMTTAQANRNFFENRKNGKTGYGSAHEIIDIDGSRILQCIPKNEVSYNCGGSKYTPIKKSFCGDDNPNFYTYGIECTHPDWGGKFSDSLVSVLVERCVDLCIEFKLDPQKDILRHYDITYKNCPKWYVQKPEWEILLNKINTRYIEKINESKMSVQKVKVELPNHELLEIDGVFVNERNYVSIRDILEALNYQVGWNGETKTVLIKDK